MPGAMYTRAVQWRATDVLRRYVRLLPRSRDTAYEINYSKHVRSAKFTGTLTYPRGYKITNADIAWTWLGLGLIGLTTGAAMRALR